MNFFRNLQIRGKMILILLCVSALSLFLFGALDLYREFQLFKKNMVRNLTVLVSTVGANSRAAIIFNDAVAGKRILSSLKEEPQIDFAALYDKDGKIFVTYSRDEAVPFEPPELKGERYKIGKTHFEIVRNILLKDKVIGKIYLRSHMEELQAEFRSYVFLAGLMLLVTLVIAFFVSVKLQSIISRPILSLAEVAKKISHESDYSIRAHYESKDELGVLYSGFNEMLDQIQKETTERKEAEELLTEAEARYEDLYNNAPDMFASIEARTAKIIQCNQTVADMLGYNKADIIGRPVFDLYHPDCLAEVKKTFRSFIETGEIHDVELQLRHKDGSKKDVSLSASAVRDENGAITHSRSIWRDITRRKETEEELAVAHKQLLHSEKLSALGKLTGSIAHEFNNPIFGMSLLLEQVKKNAGLNKLHKERLRIVIDECSRIAELTKKLQVFYKPSSEMKSFADFNCLIDDVLILLHKKTEGRGIVIKKILSPRLHKIYAVEDQMKQVILNLLQNAEESIPDESSERTITVETSSSDSEVKVSIRDSGEGIALEKLDKVFEPFFTTKSSVTGSGLGLSVSHGIVKDHGGNILVKSQINVGTTFTLVFPIKESSA